MKLFGFNINISAPKSSTASAPPVATRNFSPAEWLAGQDLDYKGHQLTNAYEQVVWVYRAINAIAEQVANIPFLFSSGERGRENLITSGPLLDFYKRPHPQINRFEYWELRIIWLMLRGECFRIPIYESANSSSFSISGGRKDRKDEKDLNDRGHGPSFVNHRRQPPPPKALRRSGKHYGGQESTMEGRRGGEGVARVSGRRRLSKILILDPAHFHHIIENNELVGWRYTGFGPHTPLSSQVFLPEEVWFEKLPNPFDFWRGMPPLYAASMAARTDFAASAFMRGIIENNGDAGVIVRTAEAIGPEQEEQVRATLRDRKRRAGLADQPALISGVTEIIKPELSSSDLQFLENRKFSRSEICAAFGVPEEIVAGTDHAKYDVMRGARLNFIENRVAPLCRRLEAEEDKVVNALQPGAVGWFDLDSLPIMQQAQRDRLATAKLGFDMGVPFNELNRVMDLGFKRLPWGDDGYLPGNVIRVNQPQMNTDKHG